MEIQVDRSTAYTYGEWVHGQILLDPHIVGVTEIVVRLSGVQLRRKFAGQPKMRYSKRVYTVSRRNDVRTLSTKGHKSDKRVFDFAIQFPCQNYDGFGYIPASFINEVDMPLVEIQHTLTVKVIRLCFPKKCLENTIVLQFMPYASINLLSEPNVFKHAHTSNDSLLVRVSMPRYLVQNYAHNSIGFEFSNFGDQSFQVSWWKWSLILHDRVNNKSFSLPLNYEQIENISNSEPVLGSLDSQNSVVVKTVQIDGLSPNYARANVGLSYTFNFSLKLRNIKTEDYFCIWANNEKIEILPGLLYKDHQSDFAMLSEIDALSKTRDLCLTSHALIKEERSPKAV